MFPDTPLYPGLQKALDDLGLTSPTEVQQRTFELALAGQDLLVSAPTGTGKTLAFLLPLIQKLCTTRADNQAGVLALILSPTRELARQLYKQCEALTGSTPVHAALLTGGEEFKFQAATLRKNPEIVVATTGRLVELLDKDLIDIAGLQALVLDEADRMLDMGFGPDVLRIAGAANADRQTLMFSATLGQGINDLGQSLLRAPQSIEVRTEEDAPALIDHRITLADDRSHKEKLLAWLLGNLPHQRALVFTNTRDNADRLGGLIRYHKHKAGVLHGEKQQSIRKNLLDQFRDGKLTVLVASDVAARGLDIRDVDLVINFDFPRRGDDYTHRVGRTGRAGARGTAVSLVSPQEWDLMVNIQRYLKLTFKRLPVKALQGKFTGPKKVKKSGKSVGSKKKKTGRTATPEKAKKLRNKLGTKPAQRLTGNETIKRKGKGLKPD